MEVNVNYTSVFENTMFQFGSFVEIKSYVVENKQTFREIKKKEVGNNELLWGIATTLNWLKTVQWTLHYHFSLSLVLQIASLKVEQWPTVITDLCK